MPATRKPTKQWSASDKLAAVIQAAGLNGAVLVAFCLERGTTSNICFDGTRYGDCQER
jgi:hypothetical protein